MDPRRKVTTAADVTMGRIIMILPCDAALLNSPGLVRVVCGGSEDSVSAAATTGLCTGAASIGAGRGLAGGRYPAVITGATPTEANP